MGPEAGRNLPLGLGAACLIPLGVFTKLYRGPAQAWVNDSAGGIIYVLFFCLFWGLFQSSRRAARLIPVTVLAITCALEFLQTWNHQLPGFFRHSLLMRTLLGNTFAWSDFPYYFLGAALGWLVLRRFAPRPGHGEY